MRFINRNVPISDVARQLNLLLDGAAKIHCWHPGRHKNGDHTASVGIRTTNNTVKCFGCGLGPIGPIDLVMDVQQLSAADSALWIAARFEVPTIPAGKRLEEPQRWRDRFGYDQGLGLLVKSGLWGTLSDAARSIAPVLMEMSKREKQTDQESEIQISYVGISRFSGIRSPNAIRKALVELQEVGFLRFIDENVRRSPTRRASRYVVTPNSEILVEHAHLFSAQIGSEIAAERELRERLRRQRIELVHGNNVSLPNRPEQGYSSAVSSLHATIPASRADQASRAKRLCTRYNSLYSTDNANQLNAIPRIARCLIPEPGTNSEVNG